MTEGPDSGDLLLKSACGACLAYTRPNNAEITAAVPARDVAAGGMVNMTRGIGLAPVALIAVWSGLAGSRNGSHGQR